MLKRYSKKEGTLYVMHVGEGIYSIVQLLEFGFPLFFNYFTKNPKIQNVDLNKVDILFCGHIFSSAMKRDAVHKITQKDKITPKKGVEYPKKWLMAENFLEPTEPVYLVEFKDYLIAKNLIINKTLVTVKDIDIIEKHEMMNAEMSPAFRLNLCYHAGKYVNPLRDIFFHLENKNCQISDNPLMDYFDADIAFYYKNFPEVLYLERYLENDPNLLERLKEKKLI